MAFQKFFTLKYFGFVLVSIFFQSAQANSNRQVEWLHLTTPKFVIYYHQEITEEAKQASIFLESAYNIIIEKYALGYIPGIPITFVLSGIKDENNGMATPLGHKIDISIRPAGFLQSDNISWLNRVLAHELTHQLTFLKIRNFFGIYGELYKVMQLPIWFLEGFAQIAGETWDPKRNSLLYMYYYHKGLKPPAEMETFIHTDIISGRIVYEYGHHFMRFLTQKYGNEFVGELLQRFTAIPIWSEICMTLGFDFRYLSALSPSFERAFLAVTGITLTEAWLDYQNTIENQVKKMVPIQESPKFKIPQYPIVYQARGTREGGVLSLGLKSIEETRVGIQYHLKGIKTNIEVDGVFPFFDLSPSENEIVYAQGLLNIDGEIHYAIKTYNLKTGTYVKAWESGNSPIFISEKEIAFVNYKLGKITLNVLNTQTRQNQEITLPDSLNQIYGLSLSRFDQSILATALNKKGKSYLIKYFPQSSTWQVVLNSPNAVEFGLQTQEGNLYYNRGKNGVMEVVVQSSDTSIENRIIRPDFGANFLHFCEYNEVCFSSTSPAAPKSSLYSIYSVPNTHLSGIEILENSKSPPKLAPSVGEIAIPQPLSNPTSSTTQLPNPLTPLPIAPSPPLTQQSTNTSIPPNQPALTPTTSPSTLPTHTSVNPDTITSLSPTNFKTSDSLPKDTVLAVSSPETVDSILKNSQQSANTHLIPISQSNTPDSLTSTITSIPSHISNSPQLPNISLPFERQHYLFDSLALDTSLPQNKRYLPKPIFPLSPLLLYPFAWGNNYESSLGASLLLADPMNLHTLAVGYGFISTEKTRYHFEYLNQQLPWHLNFIASNTMGEEEQIVVLKKSSSNLYGIGDFEATIWSPYYGVQSTGIIPIPLPIPHNLYLSIAGAYVPTYVNIFKSTGNKNRWSQEDSYKLTEGFENRFMLAYSYQSAYKYNAIHPLNEQLIYGQYLKNWSQFPREKIEVESRWTKPILDNEITITLSGMYRFNKSRISKELYGSQGLELDEYIGYPKYSQIPKHQTITFGSLNFPLIKETNTFIPILGYFDFMQGQLFSYLSYEDSQTKSGGIGAGLNNLFYTMKRYPSRLDVVAFQNLESNQFGIYINYTSIWGDFNWDSNGFWKASQKRYKNPFNTTWERYSYLFKP